MATGLPLSQPITFATKSALLGSGVAPVWRPLTVPKRTLTNRLSACLQASFLVSSRPSSSSCTRIGTVLLEDASHFARDRVVQERGIAALSAVGVRLVTASGDDLTNDPIRIMVRQILGAVAQPEKARVVAMLKHGRDRVHAIAGPTRRQEAAVAGRYRHGP